MAFTETMASGLAGACALTALHETARHQIAYAPRLDVLGMRAIAKGVGQLSPQTPVGDNLHEVALAGDLVANSLYYSLVGLGDPEGAPWRGAALGLVAGIGALVLPGPLGLGAEPSNRTPATQVMTVAWYAAGGLAAGLAYRLLAGNGRHVS